MNMLEMVQELKNRSGRDIRNIKLRGNKVYAIEYIAYENGPLRRVWSEEELEHELSAQDMLDAYYVDLALAGKRY